MKLTLTQREAKWALRCLDFCIQDMEFDETKEGAKDEKAFESVINKIKFAAAGINPKASYKACGSVDGPSSATHDG